MTRWWIEATYSYSRNLRTCPRMFLAGRANPFDDRTDLPASVIAPSRPPAMFTTGGPDVQPAPGSLVTFWGDETRVTGPGEPAPAVGALGLGGRLREHVAVMTGPVTPGAGKPPYRVPLMTEIEQVPVNGFTVVSTFSGCGGSCLGMRMAGFTVPWASEFVPAAQDTYRANHPHAHLDTRDIRTVQPADILGQLGIEAGELDIFEGSPPCASFSTAGKREAGWGQIRSYSDTKQRTDDLFFEFCRLIEGLRPRVFLAENVSGLVKGAAKGYFKEILARMKRGGYVVEARLLDASWLGVPQARQRIFFQGIREDLAAAGHVRPAWPRPLPYRYTVRDALAHVIAQGHLDRAGEGWYRDSDRPSPTLLAEQLSTKPGHTPAHVAVDPGQVIAQGDNGGFGAGGMAGIDRPSGAIGATPSTGNGEFPPSRVIAAHGDVTGARLLTQRGPANPLETHDGPAPTIMAGGVGSAAGSSTTRQVAVELHHRGHGYTEGGPVDMDAPAPTVASSPSKGEWDGHELRLVHQRGQSWNGAGDITDRPSPAVTTGVDALNSRHFQVIHDTSGQPQYSAGDISDRPSPAVLTSGPTHFQVVHDTGSPEFSHGDETDRPAYTVTSAGGAGTDTAKHRVTGPAAAGLTRDPETGEDITIGRYAIGKEWARRGRGGPRPAPAGAGQWAECRKLTLGELRRLGGFPDDFILTGSYAQRWERIGRAVPPVMMFHLAAAIRDQVLVPLREQGLI